MDCAASNAHGSQKAYELFKINDLRELSVDTHLQIKSNGAPPTSGSKAMVQQNSAGTAL